MTIRERWYKFKSRPPSRLYAYVWWETILSFVWTGATLLCFIIGIICGCWRIWAIGFAFIAIDFFWSRRELKRRKQFQLIHEQLVGDEDDEED